MNGSECYQCYEWLWMLSVVLNGSECYQWFWMLSLPGGGNVIPPVWCSGLRHCISVLAVPPEIRGSSPDSVAPGRDREAHGAAHNWSSVIRVREGLAGRDILIPLRTSDSCGRVQCTLTRSPGVRCFLWHIGAAGFSVGWALCQEAVVGLCFGGRMALDLRLSRDHMGVTAMRQDCNYYQLDTTKLGRKRG